MKYILFICSLITFLSCTDSNKTDNTNKDHNLLVLDLDKAAIKDTMLASVFIKSVTPIALETTNESLIGFLSAMQVTDSCICILDDEHAPGGSGNLFVFDKRGKYLRKIGKKGQGPGEYVNIDDFTIDEKNDKIFLVDNENDKIRVYQFSTGRFLRNIDFKDDKVKYANIQYSNNKLFVDFTYYSPTEKGPMMYTLDEATGNIESKWMDIDIHNHGWLKPFFKGESFFYCKNSEMPKYTHYFMDTIMAVNKDKLEPYLVIKSKDWVTDYDVRSHKNTTPDVLQNILFKFRELPIAFNVQNYVESERYIYFFYSKQKDQIEVLYDKKNNLLFRTKRLIDDLTYDSQNCRVLLIGCGDKNGMYSYVNTVGIPTFSNYSVKDPSSPMKPEYKKYFENKITADSNPILLYYEYKK